MTHVKLTRRQWLMGVSALGILGSLEGLQASQWFPFSARAEAMSSSRIPFLGAHQAGITRTTPAKALVVALDITAQSKPELVKLFQTLTQRIQFLMAGGHLEAKERRYPPINSGILGSTFDADGLTVDVSVGASLFDDRYGLQAYRPLQLTEMPRFGNDRLNPDLCHGDLLMHCEIFSNICRVGWCCVGKWMGFSSLIPYRILTKHLHGTCWALRMGLPI
jgi:deferrochelatase/peroxidase EfeB